MTEILLAETAEDVAAYLREISEEQRRGIGERARQTTLARHTAAHRALELESYIQELQTKGKATVA